ncbi:MAG: squalene cyclase [Nakamurella sp.]
MATDAAPLDWMLDTDPALRWQVERDLAGAPRDVYERTRARIPQEGMGAALLAHQDPDGRWASGAYFPAGFDFEGSEAQSGQPWTATTWTLTTLREFGMDAAPLTGTAQLLAHSARWEYDDLPYWGGEVDVCINAKTLANGVWLGADVAELATWFPAHQLPDDGWNCEWVEGSTRSSFHSTLNALKGMLWYEIAVGGAPEVRASRHRGEEYLLRRSLLRRESTGEPVGAFVSEFGYPWRHRYSVLNAADHFRAAAKYDGTAPDPRMTEAIEVIRSQRDVAGRWLQQFRLPGRVWLDIDVPVGEPSPWLTLFATRVLQWWDEAHSGS